MLTKLYSGKIYFLPLYNYVEKVEGSNMSANWDGCSFKEEGPWAEEKKEEPKLPLLIVALVIIAGIIVKFYVV